MQTVVHAGERKLGLMRKRVRKNVSDCEVDGFLVQIVLENNEAGVKGGGFGEDLVESGIGRRSVGSASRDTPVYGNGLVKLRQLG